MEELFKELAWKCYEKGFKFEYIPQSSGIIVQDGTTIISVGYLEDDMNWEYKPPYTTLKIMHQEVDEFIENQEVAL